MGRETVCRLHGCGQCVRCYATGAAILCRVGSVFSAAALVREKLNLFCRPRLGHVSCEPVALEVGARQGGPRTPSAWNQLVAPLIDGAVEVPE